MPWLNHFFLLSEVPTLWAGLIPPGPEGSQVNTPVAPRWCTNGLNLQFLKKGEPGVDTKSSSSERGRNRGPDHSANPLGESYKLLYLCHFNVYSCLIKSKLSNSPVNSLLTTMQKSHQSHGLFTFFCFVAMHFTMYRLNGQDVNTQASFHQMFGSD
eukprot:TRINITY_DN2844_c3_g2_i3.p1 TRINITY_DN2844_c3_g2~~TRINITY_DN2844_c3_g2_i3.p1  ORF type:complete len:156 (-),score=9.21 TRINITY_DN2844_c3_g2_i3:539-1006(-)